MTYRRKWRHQRPDGYVPGDDVYDASGGLGKVVDVDASGRQQLYPALIPARHGGIGRSPSQHTAGPGYYAGPGCPHGPACPVHHQITDPGVVWDDCCARRLEHVYEIAAAGGFTTRCRAGANVIGVDDSSSAYLPPGQTDMTAADQLFDAGRVWTDAGRLQRRIWDVQCLNWEETCGGTYVVSPLFSKGGWRSPTFVRHRRETLIVWTFLSEFSVIIFVKKIVIRSQNFWLKYTKFNFWRGLPQTLLGELMTPPNSLVTRGTPLLGKGSPTSFYTIWALGVFGRTGTPQATARHFWLELEVSLRRVVSSKVLLMQLDVLCSVRCMDCKIFSSWEGPTFLPHSP